MRHKLLHILQYHNAVVIILIGTVLVLGTYVFAQTDQGQEIIGQKQEKIISVDNSELLAADLSNFDLQFKILEINQDNATSTQQNYYITYSYRDLVLLDNSWQWLGKTKILEISQKSVENRDLGDYIAEELGEIVNWRKVELKEAQDKAKEIGPTEKIVVTEYSGLIGKILDVKNAVFPGYEPVVVEIAQIVPVGTGDSPVREPEIPNVQNEIPEPEPVGAQFIVPESESITSESEGLTRLPDGQVNQTPTPSEPPIEPPIIDNNATSTEE